MEMSLSVKCLLHRLEGMDSDSSTHIPSEALVVHACKPVAGWWRQEDPGLQASHLAELVSSRLRERP